GNDGGGSIRIPAAMTGLVGIKPSRGRVTNGPLSDLVGDLVTQGPLARTVADAAALLDVMAGYQVGDPYAAPAPRRGSFLAAARREPGRLRVGFYLASALDVPAPSDEVGAAVESTAALLSELGHMVEPVDPPFGSWMSDQFGVLWAAIAALTPIDPGREHQLRPLTRHLREVGRKLGGVEVAEVVSAIRVSARTELERCREYDAILAPTLSRRPCRVGELRKDDDPEADYRAQVEFSPFCSAYNITGQPAINVPLNWTEDGLPLGVQLAGRFGDEETIISLAAQLEQAAPWCGRHPSVW
ncbi:MAG: amidase, partial [Candidatus Nanopelagicales bacterium]|nr:amidase [Candidatus Nanopelagicales bacterium]